MGTLLQTLWTACFLAPHSWGCSTRFSAVMVQLALSWAPGRLGAELGSGNTSCKGLCPARSFGGAAIMKAALFGAKEACGLAVTA